MERITIELKSKSKQLNPSPSVDKWFLESGNIGLIEKGIADIKAGRVTEIKDVNNIWESIL